MSGLVRTYKNTVGALSRGEAVQIRLGNGIVVTAVPEDVVGPDGAQYKQLSVKMQGPDGPIEAQVRMSPATYEKSLVRADKLTPRLQAMHARVERRLLGSGR